jgi:hypothetical protein
MTYDNIEFEKFSGYRSKVSRKISITKSFTFGIPPAFFKENDLENFKFVALFYNKNEGIIGINFNNQDGFKLSKYNEGEKRAASFPARSFFQTYGLNPVDCKGRYTPEKITKEGIGDLYLIKIKKEE